MEAGQWARERLFKKNVVDLRLQPSVSSEVCGLDPRKKEAVGQGINYLRY